MRDCLLGSEVSDENIRPATGASVEYFVKNLGEVKIGLPTFSMLTEDFNFTKYSPELRYLIAGVIRNASENKEEPPLINSSFLDIQNFPVKTPSKFEEKVRHLLKYLYKNGGNESREFDFLSGKDCPLTYSTPEEFNRILKHLKENHYVKIKNIQTVNNWGNILYTGISLTNYGIKEVEKELPKMPLISLVNQEIQTGDAKTDAKINHAKELFFSEHSTLDDMRSACETLSHVLEPLRTDLENFFSTKDVSDFFQLVNKFDIRHNKDSTTKLVHEEQLEWIFYTLLNTINTYVKLKKKFP